MGEVSFRLPYVRAAMLPPKPPPQSKTAVFEWLRRNLFSSPINILLSFLAIFVVWQVLSVLAHWIWFSVWNAGSLTECRAIMDQRLGEGVRSACFAVISDRWYQLVFGFYPRSEYWRPPLALIVFFAAIAPVLFSKLPRRLLWFSVVSPFVIFTLLWGGSIWIPFSTALGFIGGWLVFLFLSRMKVSSLSSVGAFAAAITYWVLVGPLLSETLDALLPIGLLPVSSKDFGGFTLSIVIGLCSIMLSLPIGILLALGRQSELFIISKLSVVFIEVIRGVPLIVWLFTAQLLLNYFLPKGTNFDLMLRVVIMVTLFSAAYLAEVIRGGLAAIPKGQYEAADSLGLDYWKAMRLIVLPQALKISIPGIVNTFIGLFKDTTLVVFIGLYDPIGLAGSIRASTDWNGVYWEIYAFIGLVFFAFCFAMSRYSMYLERTLHRDYR